MTKDEITFDKEELARYSRHFLIPEFGREGQARLKTSKVLVIGAGGLGSPVLLYLAAAGVGTIGIVDFDQVEDSNLQRQVLYSTSDLGQVKAARAMKRLQALNPHLNIVAHQERIDSSNARRLVKEYDVIADGTDNFPTRYLINDACVLEGKVNVYASVFQFEGQVSVFNYLYPDGSRGPNYRDMFPEPPPPDLVPSCAEGGVLGVLPGIIGSMQALEVIKVVSGVGEPLVGRMFIFDAWTFETRTIRVSVRPETRITNLVDYEQFCGIRFDPDPIKSISPAELALLMKDGLSLQLIDVREPHEHALASIGGDLIPLASILNNAHRIRRDLPVVVYCRSGNRSAEAIRQWISKYALDNLLNLEGGMLAWKSQVDPALTIH